MTVRDLTALAAGAALAAALAPLPAAAQSIMMGPGIRTETTPSDRAAHNGVFDGLKRRFGLGARKVEVTVGEVEAVNRLTPEDAVAASAPQARPYSTDPPPADREARPRTAGAPVNSSSDSKAVPPGTDARQVRPAEAFPPERIETAPRAAGPKDDPRGVEERKDPGG